MLVEVDGKGEISSDYILTRVYDLGAYDPGDAAQSREGYDYAESEEGYDYAELSEPKARTLNPTPTPTLNPSHTYPEPDPSHNSTPTCIPSPAPTQRRR